MWSPDRGRQLACCQPSSQRCLCIGLAVLSNNGNGRWAVFARPRCRHGSRAHLRRGNLTRVRVGKWTLEGCMAAALDIGGGL